MRVIFKVSGKKAIEWNDPEIKVLEIRKFQIYLQIILLRPVSFEIVREEEDPIDFSFLFPGIIMSDSLKELTWSKIK